MKERLIKYIEEEKNKLDTREVKELRLELVNPSVLQEVFGETEEFDVHEWEGNYSFDTEKYTVYGTMYDGTATVELREDSED